MMILLLSKCSNRFKCPVSHGGYTRCVRNGIFHKSKICFSVHDEFTITVSALRPTKLYSWKTTAKDKVIAPHAFLHVHTYSGEQSIVRQFDPCQEGILRHIAFVIMSIHTTLDPAQHIGADDRIMCIRAYATLAHVPEYWHRECVAHSVDVNVRLKFQQSLQSQPHWAQTLAQQSKVWIAFSFYPWTFPQENKIDTLLIDGNIECVLCLRQYFRRCCVNIAGVNCYSDAVLVSVLSNLNQNQIYRLILPLEAAVWRFYLLVL